MFTLISGFIGKHSTDNIIRHRFTLNV